MIGVSKDLAKARSPFFVVMAGAVAVTVFVGFAPTFYLRGTFNPDKGLSILLHVHGFALSPRCYFLYRALHMTGPRDGEFIPPLSRDYH
jgi:hypothetical protein